MTLHLRITKAPDGAPLTQSQQTFDEQGGTLGRGTDNTWVLPDPERILSSCHCEFRWAGGHYEILDLSTNGTFINNSSEPLGKGTASPIQQGDMVEVGDYQFTVEVQEPASADKAHSNNISPGEALSPFADDAHAPVPPQPSAPDDPFASDPFSGNGAGLGAGSEVVDPLQALDGQGAAGSEPGPGWDQSAASGGGSPFASPDPWPAGAGDAGRVDDTPVSEAVEWPESRPENLIPEDWLEEDGAAQEAAPARREPDPPVAPEPPASTESPAAQPAPAAQAAEEKPAPPEPEPPRRPEPGGHKAEPAHNDAPRPPEVPDSDALLEAMGLNTHQLSSQERQALYPLVGHLMREVIDGLMQVLRSRASIKNEFRMNVTTIQPVENNPLKFSADVDEALENIFLRRSKAYKEPLAAVREGFQEIAEHQLAMIAGMRSAFEHMLGDFDPERLQARFDAQHKPNPLAPLRQSRYWDQYQRFYQGLSDNMERSFQQVFGDEFVQAYQEQLRRLNASRKR